MNDLEIVEENSTDYLTERQKDFLFNIELGKIKLPVSRLVFNVEWGLQIENMRGISGCWKNEIEYELLSRIKFYFNLGKDLSDLSNVDAHEIRFPNIKNVRCRFDIWASLFSCKCSLNRIDWAWCYTMNNSGHHIEVFVMTRYA